jgi:hypothetical protein
MHCSAFVLRTNTSSSRNRLDTAILTNSWIIARRSAMKAAGGSYLVSRTSRPAESVQELHSVLGIIVALSLNGKVASVVHKTLETKTFFLLAQTRTSPNETHTAHLWPVNEDPTLRIHRPEEVPSEPGVYGASDGSGCGRARQWGAVMKRTTAETNRLLKLAAERINARLDGEAGADVFVPCAFKSRSGETDGRTCDIGTIANQGAYATVWLDTFTSCGLRYYAGIETKSPATIQKIIDLCPARLHPVRTITMADIAAGSFSKLEDPLAGNHFGRPVLERFAGGPCFFGVYETGDPAKSATIERFVDRSSTFFFDVLDAIERSRDRADGFPVTIERRVVRLHEQFDRNARLAQACKKRDGYRCRICNQALQELYGTLGKDFAEAHHIVSLASLKGSAKTTVDDLITVCPNCHRMLHRMGEDCWDWERLRELVKKRKDRS